MHPQATGIRLRIRPGQDWRKLTQGRVAQVSAVTDTHAVMYWPDLGTQTYVNLRRFRRACDWQPIGATVVS